MKKFSSLLLVFVACLPLFSAEARIFTRLSPADSQTTIGVLVGEAVQLATEESFLPRLPYPLEDDLVVTIGPLSVTESFEVSCSLEFSFQGKILEQRLHGLGKDAASLKKNLQQALFEQLRYDALTLLPPPDGLKLDYCYRSSYSSFLPSSQDLHRGDYVAVVDTHGTKTGVLVADNLIEGEKPLVRFLPLYGKTLLPGMKLEKLAGKTLALALPVSYRDNLFGLGIEGVYSQDVGLHPFLFSLKGSAFYRFDDSLAFMALAGFEVHLPLSLVFGATGRMLSGSALVASCRVGLGFSTTEADLLFGSEAELAYRYHLSSAWALQLGILSKNWSLSEAKYDAGLSLILTTAYTW
ncbi:hypothetical protein SpiGrapes_2490 [Sphaerochaeta pleomorpha str. Grapes]|uniref:DUF3187 family protein n=1 Tax=Sphaerochaeta pleomorpha (strain ATCC BAA-1885 / DSM 22778 / Grapes) TaxID=158190 RepID=G8QU04_SPHPG|nr:hypothetical protein [Sphaerochaeta pleomorpha]AEV30251.1 hypothetical protein SpiGrapes_2490 [Sphaerochaeta pleomorpha str. Grapes]